MAAPKAKLVGGKAAKDVTLDAEIFGAEVKPHLVHETVRAELNARRAGTRGAKTRGLVSGGRAKPWRQKGTGRARAGTIRAPQFTGGGVVFAPDDAQLRRQGQPQGAPLGAPRRALEPRLERHARRARRLRLRGAVDEAGQAASSSRGARTCRCSIVATEEEETLIKSFRNLPKSLVTVPSELEVATVVWARSVLITEAALPLVEGRAS